MGWFEPTEIGERLLPVHDDIQLELRDAGGNVIPTESISFQDTERFMALEEELEDFDDPSDGEDDVDVRGMGVSDPTPDEFSAALIELGIEEELTVPDDWDATERDWEASTLPRYQVFVDLVDGRSIPVADRWKDDPFVQALVAGRDPLEALRCLDDDGE